MPTLRDHLSKRPTRRRANAEAIAHRLFVDEVENKAAKNLLYATLAALEGAPGAMASPVLYERIRTFLERHP